MKKRKSISLIIYIGVLALALSWMLGLFDGNGDDLNYGEIVSLINQEKVRTLEVEGSRITMDIQEDNGQKRRVYGTIADAGVFQQEMGPLLQEQYDAGILTQYNILPAEQTKPFDYVLPIIVAGLVLLILWVLFAGRQSNSNPMSNFGKARTVHGQAGKKVTFQDVAGVDEEIEDE